MDTRPFVLKAAKSNSGTSRLLAFLCNDAPAEYLAKAQRSNDWRERAAIAMNSNTPDSVVEHLVNDGNAVVRVLAREALDRQHEERATESHRSGRRAA